ncbi:MAG TPA: ABC transporter ATP-binding protein [Trueperaceae bacterium]
MRDLPGLLLPRTVSSIAGLAAAVVNAVLRVAVIPLFVTPLIDRVVGQGSLEALAPLLMTAAILVVGGSLALWAQDALLGHTAASLARRWREGLYRRLLGRRPGELPGTSGGLASRILHDLREVEVFQQYGLGSLVAESVAVLAIVAVLAATNLVATGLLLLLCLPLAFALRALGRRLGAAATRSQAGTEEIGGHLQEGFRHHETLRAFGATHFILGRFREANERTAAAMSRRSFLAAAQIPTTQVLAFVALGVLVAILARAAARGEMTVGQIVSFITLVALLATPAQLLPKSVAMAQQAAAAAKRLGALLEPNEVGSAPESPLSPPELTPGMVRLELKGVTVGPAKEAVLNGVDLSLDGVGLAVIVGESGAGKTTLLRTLLGFLRPRHGEVLLAGLPLARWPEPKLREAIAYVPQGHELLRGTVRDNLALGRSAPDEESWTALEGVGLAETIRQAGGLDYRLSEDGGGLSGGQRQRLAIARALLGDPPVILLDEPTSNLDEASEAGLVELLRLQARERLVVAVTHRPALTLAADRVWRIAAGRLEEGVAVQRVAER